MDFAPYQDTSPETTRALSPPPGRRSSSFSPPIKGTGSPTTTQNPWNNARSPVHSPSYQSPHGHARNPSSLSNNYFGADASRDSRSPRPSQDLESGVRSSGGWTRAQIGGLANFGGVRESLNDFETSLPLRLDYEACLAYVLLPPVGGVLLLMLEWKSDYVRFHAWQSSLLFSSLFILHLILVWSTFLSYLLLIFDLGLIFFMTRKAYVDADTLDRFEVPVLGALASRFVDDE